MSDQTGTDAAELPQTSPGSHPEVPLGGQDTPSHTIRAVTSVATAEPPAGLTRRIKARSGEAKADSEAEADASAQTTEELVEPLDLTKGEGKLGNRIFSGTATAASTVILAVLAAVGAFLVMQAWPALTDPNLKLRVIGKPEPVGLWEFTAPQIFGTVLGAVVAMCIAVPVAISVALLISHYVPRRVGTVLGYMVDLLAAIPSVVYGLWGGLWLLPLLQPFMQWMSDYLGWIPLFAGPVSPVGRVMFSAAVVLAVMIIPIITAVAREVFLRTPSLHEEAALALGATRWEMIRLAVLPFGKSGAISAAMLGLGRALGETMAVMMVLSPGATFGWSLFQAGKHTTIASNIALQYPEADSSTAAALVTAGLALFVITLVVNSAARWVVNRGSGKSRGGKETARAGKSQRGK